MDTMILYGILMILCIDSFYNYTISKRMATIERKLDALVAKMGVDLQGYVNDSINHIAELHRAGKVTEAKQLAKSTLITPEEFKKAWKVCKS